MDVKASLNNLRTAPRKVRLVADLIRNKNIAEAKSLLEFATKKSSESVLKLLNGAISSALNDFKLQESNLYVSKITVDEGPKLKRWHPMSRGRAYPIMKRTSNITLVLSDKRQETSDKRQAIMNKEGIKKGRKERKSSKKNQRNLK